MTRLVEGTCACGNRAFIQHTLVIFESETDTFKDADGRFKKAASEIRKLYACAACQARYVYREHDGAWVAAG